MERMTEVLRAGFRKAADEALEAAIAGRKGAFYPIGRGRHWSHACSVNVIPNSALSGPEGSAPGPIKHGGTHECPGSVVIKIRSPGGGGASAAFENVISDPREIIRYLDFYVEDGPESVLDSIRRPLLELMEAGVLWDDLLGLVRDIPAVDVISA